MQRKLLLCLLLCSFIVVVQVLDSKSSSPVREVTTSCAKIDTLN